MSRPKLLLISPLSGAVSGQEAATRMILDSPLVLSWEISHIDAWTARTNTDRGWPSWGSLRRFTRLLWTVRQAVREVKPQAVWIPMASNRAGFLKFALLAALAFRAKVPVVAKFGGDGFDRFLASQIGPAQDVIRNMLNRCAAVLVEAQCLTRQFAEIVPGEKVRWAYPGVDVSEYECQIRRRPSKSILYVGHICKSKGVPDLLTAMPRIVQAIKGVRLVMAGEPLRGERGLLHLHRQEGWRAVETPGVLTGTHKRFAFGEADVFAFPSLSEGFPIVILEAMASGLPIVCTPVGALPEVLTEGIHCRFVPYGNPARLAEVLSDLLSNAGRYARQRMAGENRRAVEERFNLETFAEGVRKAVGDVVR